MGRLRSLFFGSVPRKVFSTVLILVVAAVVVVGVGVATGVFGVPSVDGIDNRFGAVNETTTVIETDVRVDNPNPIGISFGGVSADYDVLMNDVTMASGTKDGVSIGSGESTVPIRTRMRNERIPDWWVTHVENGEQTTLRVEGNVSSSLIGESVAIPKVERTISTDIDSALSSSETRPINANQAPIADPLLYLNETSGSWGEVNDSTTEINMEFVVYNPKPYPIPVSELGYNMTMNDVAVGSGESEGESVIAPGSTATIRTTTMMRNGKLDEWWVSHLEKNQVTDLEIAFSARVDLSNAPGDIANPTAIEIPLDTVEHRIDTDVFGNKNETADR
ncbi:MAG: LEA type 2 family protein [Halobacteriales archaeon]